MSPENDALLVESPMFRYECCEHCRTSRCPRHDGHPDPCSADPLVSGRCQAGSTMLGEPTRVLSPAECPHGVPGDRFCGECMSAEQGSGDTDA